MIVCLLAVLVAAFVGAAISGFSASSVGFAIGVGWGMVVVFIAHLVFDKANRR